MLICGAASPTPGASRMVSIILSIKVCNSLSNLVTGFALRRKIGSGRLTIGSKAILIFLVGCTSFGENDIFQIAVHSFRVGAAMILVLCEICQRES
jgi:hypothetical protein